MSTSRANAQTAAMEALIEAHATELKLPTVKARFRQMAAEATREQQTPTAYLAALLEAEMAERAERRERRRLIDARFPQIKRLEEFRFTDNPKIPQATIAALAEGSWIDDRDSVILVGDSGTGKTHLATALAVCACHQGRRVRFATLAGLANELQEADSRRELGRVVGRYARTELVVLDLGRHRDYAEPVMWCMVEVPANRQVPGARAGTGVGIVTALRGTSGGRPVACSGRG
jgi:DNA replication protein DnaC